MATLGMLAELYGEDHVVTIVLAHHTQNCRRHRLRHEAQLIDPCSRIRQSATSTCKAQFGVFEADARSGLVLYFATLLPYWLLRRINTVTFSYEFTLFFVRQSKGGVEFGHPAARTESIQRLADELSSAHSMPCNLVNPNSGWVEPFSLSRPGTPLSCLSQVPLHVRGHARQGNRVVRGTWECFEYIMMCLTGEGSLRNRHRQVSRRVPLHWQSLWAGRKTQRHPGTGNLVWSKVFGGHAVHYGTMCHSFSRLDLDYVDLNVSEASASKLRQMKDWFGQRELPVLTADVPGVHGQALAAQTH